MLTQIQNTIWCTYKTKRNFTHTQRLSLLHIQLQLQLPLLKSTSKHPLRNQIVPAVLPNSDDGGEGLGCKIVSTVTNLRRRFAEASLDVNSGCWLQGMGYISQADNKIPQTKRVRKTHREGKKHPEPSGSIHRSHYPSSAVASTN